MCSVETAYLYQVTKLQCIFLFRLLSKALKTYDPISVSLYSTPPISPYFLVLIDSIHISYIPVLDF